MFTPLREVIQPGNAHVTTESVEEKDGSKSLYMEGIFIQGGVKKPESTSVSSK